MANMSARKKQQSAAFEPGDFEQLEEALAASLEQASLETGVVLPPLESFQEVRRQHLKRPQTQKKESHAYHHGNLRESLIGITMEQAEARGIADISLRSIAKQAGVSAPALYRHFADKDALLVAVAEQGFQELRDWLLYAAPLEMPFQLRLRRFCQAYLNFMTEYALYFQLMFSLEIKHRQEHAALTQAYEEIMSLWAHLIVSGRQEGLVRQDSSAEAQVLHLAASLQGFANFRVLGMIEAEQTEEHLDALLESIMQGLQAPENSL